MPWGLGPVACVVLWLAAASSALANERYALLIGNQSYSNRIKPLKNPHTDIELVAEALIRSGFKRENIELVRDANLTVLNAAASSFAQKLREAGEDALGFFYYSGHGAAGRVGANPSNYIIPIGAEDSRGPVELFLSSIPLTNLVNTLRNAARFADLIVVFDACRDEMIMRSTDARTFIAEPLDHPGSNTFLSFSTQPGSVAYDGSGFGRVLAEELSRAGQHHVDVFFNVRLAATKATERKQIPWHLDQFEKRLYFLQKPAPEDPEEIAFWHKVISLNSVEGFQEYINRYRDSPRLREAQRRIWAKQEELAWIAASTSGVRADLEDFLTRYPDGRFLEKAHGHLNAILKAEEDRDWRVARNSQSEEKLLEFLDKYPRTTRQYEIREMLRQLKGKKKQEPSDEKAAWEQARLNDRIQGYVRYLALFGDSSNAPEARQRLAALNESRSWLQLAETRSIAGIENFIEQYPKGIHAEDARSLIAALTTQTATPSPPPAANDERRRNLFFPRATFTHFSSGKIRDRLDLRKAQPIRRLLLTNDLAQLYSGGDDGLVRIWDLDGVRRSEVLAPIHTRRIYALARSGNSRYMATGAWDRQVFLWDSHTNRHFAAITVRPQIYSMAFSPTGRWIAAAGTNGQVDFIHVNRQTVVRTRQITPARRIHAIAYLPNRSEDLIVGDASGALRLWTVRRGHERHVAGAHSGEILAIGVNSNGSLVASAGLDRSIRFWTDSLSSISNIDNAHRRYITALRFTPDGRYLASGGADFLVRIWDTKTRALVRGPFVGHLGDIETIEFSPDGKYMFTSSEDKTAKIWDVDENKLLYTLVAFPNGGYIVFDPTERYFASDDVHALLKRETASREIP